MPKRRLPTSILNFDIDTLLNPLLPGSLLPRLPRPISHFLGHRPPQHPQSDLPPTLLTLHAFLSTFTALLAVTAITQHAPSLHRLTPPILLPSLGAGALLNFTTINLPASQPRHTILGQAISAAVGVGIARLFALNDRFDDLLWVAAPLAVALAGLAMRVTGTVHPPGGATAALAVASGEVRRVGWWLVALVTVGTTVMVGCGCVLNNLGRRWPEFWWTGEELPVGKGEKDRGDEDGDGVGSGSGSDLEKVGSGGSESGLRDGVCQCCGRGS